MNILRSKSKLNQIHNKNNFPEINRRKHKDITRSYIACINAFGISSSTIMKRQVRGKSHLDTFECETYGYLVKFIITK